MLVYKPPHPLPKAFDAQTLFLAGSIEMGVAERWQDRVQELMSDTNWTLFNPRRSEWDSSWVQSINNPVFKQQVEWELEALEKSNKVLLYLSPDTHSPISLLEFGLFGDVRDKMIVVCPDGFWRKGNVDVVCHRYGITQADSLEEAVDLIKHN